MTYDIVVPSGASGTLVLDPAYKDAVVDGVPLDRPGPAAEIAQPARSPGATR